MTGRDRSRVSTRLYWSALRDAIAWQESILATHDPRSGQVVSCCTPEKRCGQYETEARLLSRYKAARAALSRRPR